MAKDPKNRKAKKQRKAPPAGPHNKSDLNDPAKAPGTGILPEEDEPENTSQTQSERASDLAEDTIDELSDQRASNSDVNDRKSQLIDGPVEFRKTRVDND